VIPWVLERIAATRSRELFTLAILVIALGIAVGSARVFGVSTALGAFLAGMIVGRSDFSMRAASEALPMRDAFAVLFFVSIGMIFDPLARLESPAALMATLAIVLPAKPAAALGKHLGVMPDDAVNTLVATAIISITLNPLLYRSIGPGERWLASRYLTAVDVAIDNKADTGVPTQRAIVVGYGPVGQTVAQLLLDNEIEPTVIELNLDTVRRLKAFDVRAIYGDASRPGRMMHSPPKARSRSHSRCGFWNASARRGSRSTVSGNAWKRRFATASRP
jgi:monovalent cation:H+ antiporter-2, CPA2 family